MGFLLSQRFHLHKMNPKWTLGLNRKVFGGLNKRLTLNKMFCNEVALYKGNLSDWCHSLCSSWCQVCLLVFFSLKQYPAGSWELTCSHTPPFFVSSGLTCRVKTVLGPVVSLLVSLSLCITVRPLLSLPLSLSDSLCVYSRAVEVPPLQAAGALGS